VPAADYGAHVGAAHADLEEPHVRRAGAVAVSLAAAGLVLLSGCSTSIDVDTLEQSVQTGLAEQLGGEWTVQCPDSMEIQAGLTTNCMATSDGGESVDVNITQTDDQGNVTWETVE
jgi:hypothetical protein